MEAWWGHLPLCPFKRWAALTEVSFHKNIIGNFMVYQDRLETNSYSYSDTQKIQNDFLPFLLLNLRLTLWLNRNKHIW